MGKLRLKFIASGMTVFSLLLAPSCGFISPLMKHQPKVHKGVGDLYMSVSVDTSRTQEIMSKALKEAQAGGAGGASTFEGLLRAEAGWAAVRNMKTGAEAGPPPLFVRTDKEQDSWDREVEYDAVVCGGTLGIFLATALQKNGFKVAVVERGRVIGRNQDWNIARAELMEVVEEILDEEDLKDIISIEFNPIRAGFKAGEDDANGFEVTIENVLNLGVRPAVLVEKARAKFESCGGVVLEETNLQGMDIYNNAAVLNIEREGEQQTIASRLVLDCMGNASPVVRQIRWGQRPDGICLVVGSCARGFEPEKNTFADIIYANTPIIDKGKTSVQYFWEAFPAGSGPADRTTYLFTYMDAHPDRMGLLEMMEDYWKLLPEYQGVDVDDLEVLRVLFGFFPTYKDSPLLPAFNRVLQIGDASGIQSPLSFGGFACICRHLSRISRSVGGALESDCLSKEDLARINFYQPALSTTWMFQKAMSVSVGERIPNDLILKTLQNNFRSMEDLGDPVLRPFLQDVVQFNLLARTLVGVTIKDPLSILPLVTHCTVPILAEWMGHFLRLGLYSALYNTYGRNEEEKLAALPPSERFRSACKIDSWKYGSALDYNYEKAL